MNAYATPLQAESKNETVPPGKTKSSHISLVVLSVLLYSLMENNDIEKRFLGNLRWKPTSLY